MEIRLNTNRHTLISFREVGAKTERRLRLSIHRRFLEAPDAILQAVAAWLDGRETTASRNRLRHWMNAAAETASGARGEVATSGQAEATSGADGQLDFFQAPSEDTREPKAARGDLPPAPEGLQWKGRHHDLRSLADRLNYQYFEGACPVHITWSTAPADRLPPGEAAPRPRRRGRGGRSILFGTYSAREHLVRVHPRLDAADVPDYFVEYIVYHEMLHKFAPPRLLPTGRRDIHTREFRHLERRFAHYRRARIFERRFMRELL